MLKRFELIRCGLGDSLFKHVIDPYWPELTSRPAFHRVCTLMRIMGVQTAISEELNISNGENLRFQREKNAIQIRLTAAAKVYFRRLTFFRKNPIIEENKVKGVTENDYLGFVVIGTIKYGENVRSYIFESVVRELEGQIGLGPWASFLHVKRRFQCPVLNSNYIITGSFFCQQNSITNVCAHVCTVMMLNNCQEIVKPVTCEDVNKLLGIDHKNRLQEVPEELGNNERVTHEGLYLREIERVVREYGFIPYRMDSKRRRSHREAVYSFTESGYPVLLTFNSLNGFGQPIAHVLTVVGHSLNRQSWFPAAHACYARQFRKDTPYVSTLSWVNEFVVHDDNFGMQLYLPAHSFRPDDYPDSGPEFMPTHVMGILPQKAGVKCLGNIAQDLAWDTLNALFEGENGRKYLSQNYYVDHLRPHITGENEHPKTAVLRTLLLSVEQYLSQLKNQRDNQNQALCSEDISQIGQLLKNRNYIWIVEVSEPDLYVGNQSRVLEVIIDPQYDGEPNKIKNLESGSVHPAIFIRLPHLLMKIENPNPDFASEPYKGVSGYFPLLKLKAEQNVVSLFPSAN